MAVDSKTWAAATLAYAEKHGIDPTTLNPDDPKVQAIVKKYQTQRNARTRQTASRSLAKITGITNSKVAAKASDNPTIPPSPKTKGLSNAEVTAMLAGERINKRADIMISDTPPPLVGEEPEQSKGSKKGTIIDPWNVEYYKIRESHTGTTVSFNWYMALPPTENDIDDAFRVALGLRPSEGSKASSNKVIGEVVLLPNGPKLSKNETLLASRLSRISELEKLESSEKNAWQTPKQAFFSNLTTTFLPPIAIFILGAGFSWAFAGFIPRQK